jgi:hypothetical protein
MYCPFPAKEFTGNFREMRYVPSSGKKTSLYAGLQRYDYCPTYNQPTVVASSVSIRTPMLFPVRSPNPQWHSRSRSRCIPTKEAVLSLSNEAGSLRKRLMCVE